MIDRSNDLVMPGAEKGDLLTLVVIVIRDGNIRSYWEPAAGGHPLDYCDAVAPDDEAPLGLSDRENSQRPGLQEPILEPSDRGYRACRHAGVRIAEESVHQFSEDGGCVEIILTGERHTFALCFARQPYVELVPGFGVRCTDAFLGFRRAARYCKEESLQGVLWVWPELRKSLFPGIRDDLANRVGSSTLDLSQDTL